MRGSTTSRASIIRRSIFRSEAISKAGKGALVILILCARSALSQSMFLDGEYTLGNRAAGMSAYVADPDYAHSVSLNPAKLGYVATIYAAADYEYFSRDVGELFLRSGPSEYLANGKLNAWDISVAFPAGPLGGGLAFSRFDFAGWRTTVSSVAAAVRVPFGFTLGATGKYVTVTMPTPIPGGMGRADLGKFTFDVGAMNKTVLANTTFFRAILSAGAEFTNVLAGSGWTFNPQRLALDNAGVNLPQSFSFGVAYTFASNYRLYDYELFRVTGAADYSHVLSGSAQMDSFNPQRDLYRLGLETIALGVLALRIGYTLKTPIISGQDAFNNLSVARMGSGFSYGFSLRFPVKLVLPALPVTSLELSYAKNPEWSAPMYHDLFGVTLEMLF